LHHSETEDGLRTKVAQLEQALDAKEKTIRVLAQRVESCVADSSAFAVYEQNIVLEDAVARKTELMAAQQEELRNTLQKLQLTQVQLLHAQKLEAIGSLAAGVAHEINTPTQYASDNVCFLRDAFADMLRISQHHREQVVAAGLCVQQADIDDLEYLSQEIPRAILETLEGLGRITSIVRAMKDFSHPSVGEFQDVDLKALIQTTVTVARNEWRYVADLTTQFEEDLPSVPGLRDELGQVILNFLVNAAHAVGDAIKHDASQKGKITIAAKTSGDFVEVSISDTGCGIPEALQHRIFEPFFTTKPVGRGTGQGLPIARAVVVEKHHGKIEFDSQVGVGTTFRIYLPIKAPSSLEE